MEQRIRLDKQRLGAIMALRGITGVQLAKAIDVHPNAIVRLKAVERTSFATLEKVCSALNCSPFDLLVAEGYPAPFLGAPASH